MKSLTQFVNEAKITSGDLKTGSIIYGVDVRTNKTMTLKISKIETEGDDNAYISFDTNDYKPNGSFIRRDLFLKGIHKDEESVNNWFVITMFNVKTETHDTILFSTSKEGLKEALESKFGGRIKELSDRIAKCQKELDEINKQINVEFND